MSVRLRDPPPGCGPPTCPPGGGHPAGDVGDAVAPQLLDHGMVRGRGRPSRRRGHRGWCAGLLDDDDPGTAIRLEAAEELGVSIGEPTHVLDVWVSPGSVTERVHLLRRGVHAGGPHRPRWRARRRGCGHRRPRARLRPGPAAERRRHRRREDHQAGLPRADRSATTGHSSDATCWIGAEDSARLGRGGRP